ncbi:hypothetical protein DPMN_112973 [Dreissena polymorpha]|uniref:Uncharacterized protein n=1 Tax=Dreissena polymorpha TaxID=45954 RepID=A0A9D4KH38_DREPO|nr:hypothetical protein DPMN_112973 [Dreissena polymorpha]
MRENLLFYGCPEVLNENCEETVKSIISKKLRIVENITLDRVHRLGKPSNGKCRPIVAKFHYYQLVRTTAITKTNDLKTTGLGIGIQQTKAVLQQRREKNALFNREKSAGKQVKRAGAKLLSRENGSSQFKEVTHYDKEGKLNVIAWNVNGLARKINDVDFQEYAKKYDLILLSENWLKKSSAKH